MGEEIPEGTGLALCEMHNTDEHVGVRGGLPSEWPALPLSQVEVSPDESAGAVLLADLLLKSNLSMPPSPNRPGRSGSGPAQTPSSSVTQIRPSWSWRGHGRHRSGVGLVALVWVTSQ